MSDALAVLADDHHHVLELLDRLAGGAVGSQDAERRTVAQQLAIAESKHEAIEEQCFWPLVRSQLDNGDELAEQAIEQEEAGKKLIHELDHTPAESPDFEAVLHRLDRAVREHIAFEEGQVWPKLRLSLGEPELAELGRRLESAGRTAPTRPHPRTPSNPRLLGTVGPAVGALDRARDAVTGRGKQARGTRGKVLLGVAVGLPAAALGGWVLWRLLARGWRPATALRKAAAEAARAELAAKAGAIAVRSGVLTAARGASSAASRGTSSAASHGASSVHDAGSAIGAAARGVGAAVGSAALGVGSTVGSAAHEVGSAAHGVGSTVGSAAHEVGSAVGSAARGVGSTVGSAAHGVGSTVGSAAHQVGSAAHGVGSTVGSAAHQVGSALGR
jgi:hypothetical protein